MKLRSTADFAELEQKVVGFTDLRILVVIERAKTVGGRQCPHPSRPVSRVARLRLPRHGGRVLDQSWIDRPLNRLIAPL
jgi:hypothetical protein